ncbi:MAG: YggT family protein [Candidatus Omnitrophota bacterium]
MAIVLSNFLFSLAKVVDIVLTVFSWCVIARALISWFNPGPYSQIVQLLYRVTEPVLDAVRRKITFSYNTGIDISPMIVVLAIIFLKSFIVKTLVGFAYRIS